METIKKIAFTEIEQIPLLIKDFLHQKWTDFQSDTFSIQNFEKKIQQKSDSFSSEQRKILQKVLLEQQSTLALTPKQNSNIELISEQNTFTITTGHQLNLFSGPVFFIYKILQTIKTADFLKEQFPEMHFVPIFWMATEDHDFLEINHFNTKENYYEIQGKSGDAVGRMVIEDQEFISEFEKEAKDWVFGKKLILMMKESYKIGNTFSKATRILVHELFSQYGLLILDGDSRELKAQMKGIFKEELLQNTLKKTTETPVDFLTKNYGKVQVNPREINLFYLSQTRNRIDFDGEFYRIKDTNILFSEKEMLRELEQFPEKLSPNALMRPVYQEKILPNLAYIGGNAEIMYWLELKEYFKHLRLDFPILIPRNSFLFLTEKQVKKIEKLRLNIENLFQDFQEVAQEKLLENHPILDILEKQKQTIENNFQELKKAAEKTDISFGNLVKAEETRQLKSFKRMEKRLLRAEKIKQKEMLDRLQDLFLQVHPGNIWQERKYNFSVFYAEEGKIWLEKCLQEIDVEKSELIVIAN